MKRTRESRSIRLPLPMIRAAEAVYSQVPNANCQGLCQECCGPVTMTRFEWDRIAARLGYRPRPTAEQAAELTCPMLADGKCAVYDIRPLICRLWGAVEGMPCPFGCEPDGGRLSDERSHELLRDVGRANHDHYDGARL